MKGTQIEGKMVILESECNGLPTTEYRIFFIPYAKLLKPLCEVAYGDAELGKYSLEDGLEAVVAKEWLKEVRLLTRPLQNRTGRFNGSLLTNLWRSWRITIIATGLSLLIVSWPYVPISLSPVTASRASTSVQRTNVPLRSSKPQPRTIRSHVRPLTPTRAPLSGFRRVQVAPNEVDYIAKDVTARIFTPRSNGSTEPHWKKQENIGDDVTIYFGATPSLVQKPE